MAEVADEVAPLAGVGDGRRAAAARRHPAAGRAVRARPARRPRARARCTSRSCEVSGGGAAGPAPTRCSRARCEAGLGRRGLPLTPPGRGPARRRARDDPRSWATRRTSSPSPTSSTSSGGWGCGARPAGRARAASSPTCWASPTSTRSRYGLLMERFLSPLRHALPDIDIDVESARRTEVYEPDPRPLRRRAVRLRVDDGHLPGPARHPRRRRRARAAARRDRRDRQGVSRTSGPTRCGPRCATCPSCAPAALAGERPARPAVPAGRAARRAAAPHRAAPVRGAAVRPHPARPHPGRGELAGLPDEPVRQGRRRGSSGCSSSTCSASGCSRRSRTPSTRSSGSTATRVDIDAVPRDDPATFALIQSTRTLGCFQIESPGQRELVGKFAPETFDDLIIDISLFRPGAGQERHGDAVPRGPAGLAGALRAAPRPARRSSPRPAASSSSTSRCCRSSRR